MNLPSDRVQAPAEIVHQPGPVPRGDSVKTARERAEEKRQEKLELVQEQVESGSLVIRQMTDEERQRYPQVPPRPRSRSAW